MNNNNYKGADGIVDEQLIRTLLDLPKKILLHEDLDSLAQIVLHELGHDQHLGLKRATYIVDNPEFGCIKGVAGFCKSECKYHKNDLWHDPHCFCQDMQEARFHQEIKHFAHNSVCHKSGNLAECNELHKLGNKIGIDNPTIYTWPMRNGNKGVLIFEDDEHNGKCKKDPVLLDYLSVLLGLCRLH